LTHVTVSPTIYGALLCSNIKKEPKSDGPAGDELDNFDRVNKKAKEMLMGKCIKNELRKIIRVPEKTKFFIPMVHFL
jgi:hypothetical protein